MAKTSLRKVKKYMDDRANELKTLALRGDPWFFLCASSFIEYMAKLDKGECTNQTDYKDFLNKYLFVEKSKYADFRYSNPQTKLVDQMYHVLRCGLVHSFSLIPDPKATTKGGKNRSILLAHKSSTFQHLQPYVNNKKRPKVDGCIFIAEEFADDLAKMTQDLFAKASKRSEIVLRNNILKWVNKYPPVSANF